GSDHRTRFATEPEPRDLSAGRCGTACVLPRARSGPEDQCRARGRSKRADLDSRIKPVWSAAGCGSWAAVRLRIAFRAGADDVGDSGLPNRIPTLRVSQSVAAHAGT